MFQSSLCSSSRALDRTVLHMVFSTWCAGWCLGKQGRPASQDTSQHIKCWKSYAVLYDPALLKMGIMMTETCWANGLLINHNLLHLVGLTRHFILRLHGHTNIIFFLFTQTGCGNTAYCFSITLLSFILLMQFFVRKFIIFIVIHSLIEGNTVARSAKKKAMFNQDEAYDILTGRKGRWKIFPAKKKIS